MKNPFESEREWRGKLERTVVCDADDRLAMVKRMSMAEARAVLAMSDVQLAVRTAAGVRIRKLMKGAKK